MQQESVVRMQLELAAGAEPLAGRLLVEGAPPKAFTGWLGLNGAIDALLATSQEIPMTDEDRIEIGQISIRFRLEAADTGGALTMFECHVPADARVPLPHSHDGFEESVYGLRGELVFTVDGDDHALGTGDALSIPSGAVHGFTNTSGADAAFLAVATPGVFGPDYFRELADALSAGPPDPAVMAAILRRHGLTPAPPKER